MCDGVDATMDSIIGGAVAWNDWCGRGPLMAGENDLKKPKLRGENACAAARITETTPSLRLAK